MEINEIARIAENIAPSDCNKAALYSVMKDAINNDGQLNELALAKMYRYFAPKTPAKPKTVEQWIAQAVPKSDARYYLNYIYSDGKRLIATNGGRLHVVTKSYAPGFYDKNMMLVHGVDFAKYPDVDRVINDRPNQVNFNDLETSDFKGLPVYRFDGVTVNAQFLKTACQIFDNPVINYGTVGDSIIIREDDKIAVVMPIREY